MTRPTEMESIPRERFVALVVALGFDPSQIKQLTIDATHIWATVVEGGVERQAYIRVVDQ